MGIKRTTMKDKELKEQFFALYWGQNVFKVKDYKGVWAMAQVTQWCMTEKDIESGYLELRPLSSISDDLKKELFEKVNSIASAMLGRDLTADIDYLLENAELGFVNSFVVDFLRHHGFAIQWMGISVEEQVELGWVRLKG